MASAFDKLVQAVLALPADQRTALAHRLPCSMDAEPGAETETLWEQEIARRIARADAGETVPVPAAEVFARLQCIKQTPAGTAA